MSVELKCVQEFWGNGKLKREEFFNSDGERHNAAGLAFREWNENGQLAYEMYCLNGNRHNAAGPAYRQWHGNGQLAYEMYYLNGEFHNAAGPAYRYWHENGTLAIEEYWLNGRKLTKAAWEAAVNPAPCDGKVVEIEGRKYKLVAD
jgi:antitoxin component YwqK of YwqJK toxin-antitoxin module